MEGSGDFLDTAYSPSFLPDENSLLADDSSSSAPQREFSEEFPGRSGLALKLKQIQFQRENRLKQQQQNKKEIEPRDYSKQETIADYKARLQRKLRSLEETGKIKENRRNSKPMRENTRDQRNRFHERESAELQALLDAVPDTSSFSLESFRLQKPSGPSLRAVRLLTKDSIVKSPPRPPGRTGNSIERIARLEEMPRTVDTFSLFSSSPQSSFAPGKKLSFIDEIVQSQKEFSFIGPGSYSSQPERRQHSRRLGGVEIEYNKLKDSIEKPGGQTVASLSQAFQTLNTGNFKNIRGSVKYTVSLVPERDSWLGLKETPGVGKYGGSPDTIGEKARRVKLMAANYHVGNADMIMPKLPRKLKFGEVAIGDNVQKKRLDVESSAAEVPAVPGSMAESRARRMSMSLMASDPAVQQMAAVKAASLQHSTSKAALSTSSSVKSLLPHSDSRASLFPFLPSFSRVDLTETLLSAGVNVENLDGEVQALHQFYRSKGKSKTSTGKSKRGV